MKPYSGTLLMATGALHWLALGVFGLDPLLALIRSGYIGQVEAAPLHMAVFWSGCLGAMLVLLGGLMRDMERRGVSLPGWLGWALVALGAVGVAGIPVSGFWLVLPQGGWIVSKASRSTGRSRPRERAPAL